MFVLYKAKMKKLFLYLILSIIVVMIFQINQIHFQWRQKLGYIFENNIIKVEELPIDTLIKPSDNLCVKGKFINADQFHEYNNSGPHLKKILFWNSFFNNKNYGFGYGQEPFIHTGCKVNTCYTTRNKTQFPLKDIDAIIFHGAPFDRSRPSERFAHTRYIFLSLESPLYRKYGNGALFRSNAGFYNWTMTYRQDSDIPYPYGYVFQKKFPNLNYTKDIDYSANKSKMAAWFVSNCADKSGRLKLAKNLSKYIKIDIFGRCGNPKNKCPRSEHTSCLQMLKKDYKFYLSFENALCQDYVTEKFYDMMPLNVIPVVYGLGSWTKIAPSHSYIDALQFKSSKDLAEYLIFLDQNPKEYNKYFWWKRDFFVNNRWEHDDFRGRAFCKLCEMLHNNSEPKIYHNLFEWFVTNSTCLSLNHKNVSRLIS